MAKEAEERVLEKEQELSQRVKEVEALKKRTFRASQALFQLRQDEANFIAEISGAQSANKNLKAKIARLDNTAMQQQEHIYNAEFQIQQLERKVSRAKGERSDEEKKVLNEKIAALTEELEAVQAQHKMLTAQVKKLHDEHRRLKTGLRNSLQEKEKIDAELAELELVSAAADQTLREREKAKEEAMVGKDVLKLEVLKLKDRLSVSTDEVFNLENRKYQLAMSMEERKKEINVHR